MGGGFFGFYNSLFIYGLGMFEVKILMEDFIMNKIVSNKGLCRGGFRVLLIYLWDI